METSVLYRMEKANLVYSFKILKLTSRGIWIKVPAWVSKHRKKFILITARKQWASLSPELDREQFLHRKKSHIRHLEQRLLGIISEISEVELNLSPVYICKPQHLETEDGNLPQRLT